ncbi:LuxR C-terminal-related transcriptional regulator [Mycolicibacterium holsaticum]|uniref:HTH luxR-type domain-containing protein n=1 Tax=Mycolicibacterium holsaticum TaxID=152142 RepID=A0A1E3RY22_9MYCO|nr:LuxR C-terminal-related transcriptional regulator [Mycolicibacterium holsaticum]ODQ94257.1 hypothetical protein BHQ17_09840 [Mycolicibacterium holsaticum]
MDREDRATSAGSAPTDERLRAVLAGLRSIADPDDPKWRPAAADARAILDDAWTALADVLDDNSDATALLTALRKLADADVALVRVRDASHRLGEALGCLESAPCSVAELMELAPHAVTRLGFDRAIFSRIVDGVWISHSVYVPDDPEWAAQINRAGQEQPQPLVRGLFETEIVRRREARLVIDVQHEARVHRPIAEASRSNSYVAAPVMAGDRVVALLHTDRYLQKRETDAADCEMLAAYAKGLALAFSRARAAAQLDAVGGALRLASQECDNAASSMHDFDLDETATAGEPGRVLAGPTRRAVRSVRDRLTSREIEILEHMAHGRTNGAIATKLFISEGTVKQHVKHILRKLGAENRVEAVSMLYQSDGA